MKATVTWQKELSFLGVSDGGFPVLMDSDSSPDRGTSPMEMLGLALAGCTAMDVISILIKKRQQVAHFEVTFHGQRSSEHPKRVLRGTLEFVVRGRAVQEQALVRAIELSITRYCSVQATLANAFPMEYHYSIFEDDKLSAQGSYEPAHLESDEQTPMTGHE